MIVSLLLALVLIGGWGSIGYWRSMKWKQGYDQIGENNSKPIR